MAKKPLGKQNCKKKLTNWELYQPNSVNEYRNDIPTVYIRKLSFMINNVGNVFPIRNVLN